MTEVQAGTRKKRLILLLTFLGLIFLLIFAFRAVLAPFLVAIFVAYLIDPVVERLAPLRPFDRFGVGRGGAIVVIYLVLLACLYVGSVFAVPALGQQVRQMRSDLPAAKEALETKARSLAKKYKEWVGTDATNDEPGKPEPAEKPEEDEPTTHPLAFQPERVRFHLKPQGEIVGEVVGRTESQVAIRLGDEFLTLDRERVDYEEPLTPRDMQFDFMQWLRGNIGIFTTRIDAMLSFFLGFVLALINTVYKLILVLMITAFLVIDRPAIVAFIRSVPPVRYQPTYDKFTEYIDRGLAGVIRGQLTICLVNGILTWIGLYFLNVRYSLVLGFVAGVFSLIPIFGTILSTIPIVLIAWGTGSLQKGILALGWILFIHLVEANLLNPKIMGTASKIHPVVVIFALLAGEHAYGIVGALLAVPTASIVQAAFRFYVVEKQHERIAAEQVADADTG